MRILLLGLTLAVVVHLTACAAAPQAARFEPRPLDGSAGSMERIAADPLVRMYLAQLLQLAGGGFRDVERAAFLVSDGAQVFRCLLWPHEGTFRSEAFRGVIPGGTVAVMHTHPYWTPRPSPHDRQEARRAGMPFLVISPRHIYAVTRAGEIKLVVDGRTWASAIGPPQTTGCEPSLSSARHGWQPVRPEQLR